MRINLPKTKQIKIIEKRMRVYHGYAFPAKLRIEIRSNQSPIEYLGTLVHELLHIAFPDMSETKIDAIARMITYHLWRQGYRRKGKSQRHRHARKRTISEDD
jgi:hypothetical protein